MKTYPCSEKEIKALEELLGTGLSGLAVFPAFCDVHVHFREPGFEYKENIRTGSKAAAHGGYTAVCTMPNLKPVPDCVENLKPQTALIERDAEIAVYPYASITKGEEGKSLSDLEELAPHVCAFSDDGHGIQSREMMRSAMKRIASLNKLLAAHCEVESLVRGGIINDGAYARAHGLPGICSESEYKEVERDIELAAETGCALHICHISTRQSVELVRQAKRDGIDVSCETAPHYLLFDEDSLCDNGFFKMNPPLRGRKDRQALLEALEDGTVDCIATDHAPHSAEEKSKGLRGSLFGVTGLETAFPALYTGLVKTGLFSLSKIIELISLRPRERFGLPAQEAFCVWDLDEQISVSEDFFLSKGRATPFFGQRLFGKCKYTVLDGKILYSDTGTEA